MSIRSRTPVVQSVSLDLYLSDISQFIFFLPVTLPLPHTFSLALSHSRNNSLVLSLIFSLTLIFTSSLLFVKIFTWFSMCHALPTPVHSLNYLSSSSSDSVAGDCSLFPCHPSLNICLTAQCFSFSFLSFSILSLHLCSPSILKPSFPLAAL